MTLHSHYSSRMVHRDRPQATAARCARLGVAVGLLALSACKGEVSLDGSCDRGTTTSTSGAVTTSSTGGTVTTASTGGGGGGLSHAVSLAAGMDHTCVLSDSGAARCWGDGSSGRLGYGSGAPKGDDELPSSVGDVNLGATVIQVVAGGNHTCALTDLGNVRCWGYWVPLGYGLGFGVGDVDEVLPSSAGDLNVGAKVVQLAAGTNYTCALTDAGKVRCWGQGPLGYGNTDWIGASSAGDVDVGASVVQLAGGNSHICALTDAGAVRCWGYGAHGQLGYGNTETIGDDEPPSSAGDVDVGAKVVQLDAGTSHTCALTDAGKVRCWGYGLLGYGINHQIGDDELPSSAGDVNVGAKIVHVAAGGGHTCALTDAGKVRCWGYGSDGVLGYGNTDWIGGDELPFSPGDVDVGASVVQVVAGGGHTCALTDSGNVRCWGANAYGQLGYGNTKKIGDDELPSSAGDVQYQ